MKTILEAAYHLMFFKTYTFYDRSYEISLGIIAWFEILIILITILK